MRDSRTLGDPWPASNPLDARVLHGLTDFVPAFCVVLTQTGNSMHAFTAGIGVKTQSHHSLGVQYDMGSACLGILIIAIPHGINVRKLPIYAASF